VKSIYHHKLTVKERVLSVKEFLARFLNTVSGKPIIIGIGDQVMPNSLIQRVEYISQQIAAF
jgi:hypothetical protein